MSLYLSCGWVVAKPLNQPYQPPPICASPPRTFKSTWNCSGPKVCQICWQFFNQKPSRIVINMSGMISVWWPWQLQTLDTQNLLVRTTWCICNCFLHETSSIHAAFQRYVSPFTWNHTLRGCRLPTRPSKVMSNNAGPTKMAADYYDSKMTYNNWGVE